MVMSAVSSVSTPGVFETKNAPLPGRGHIDIVDPGPVIGDQAQLFARLPQQPAINGVGHGGHKDIRALHRCDQFFSRHGRVIVAQLHIEQLAQPGFHRLGQPSRNDNTQTFSWHLRPPIALQTFARHGIVAQDKAGHKNPNALRRPFFETRSTGTRADSQ